MNHRDSMAAMHLTLTLQTEGPMPARALRERLRISQPTFSRHVRSLTGQLETIGGSRSRRYALRRNVRQLGSSWPVYLMGENGQAREWGRLTALHGGFRFVPAEGAGWLDRPYPQGVYSGLPFFLQDTAPDGYLGRAIARRLAPLQGYPADPRSWSEDDVLMYQLTQGSDLPGALIVGEPMLVRALRQRTEPASPTLITLGQRATRYPEMAAAAQRGELPGSSAGGEQPKFLCGLSGEARADRAVLVKFTAADSTPAQARWSDLLVCEHLVAVLLREHGWPACRTELLDAGGRRFLEVERFDRSTGGGRRGYLSLRSALAGLVDEHPSDWAKAAELLSASGWLSPGGQRLLRLLWVFGDLIGNSDMHFGNVSLGIEAPPPFELSPTYDMLPMLHAPGVQGERPQRAFNPRPPLPTLSDVWPEAAAAAALFWGRAEADARLSDGFRREAGRCAAVVGRLRQQA